MMRTQTTRAPEAKALAGSAGAGAGAIIAGFITWALDTWAFPEGPVPGPVIQLIALVTTVAAAYTAAWWAPHTLRRDLDPAATDRWVELGPRR
jgi:hypothetical protein